MMASIEEENFPRGCRKVAKAPQKRPKHDNNLFLTDNVHKAKKAKKSKKIQKDTVTDETFHNSIKIQGTLSYNKIQEGMVILGCIRHVTNFSLEVEFPGLTFGSIHVTDISDVFTKHLSKQLEENESKSEDILRDMFKVGQFVAAKVLHIENDEKGMKLKCSLKPTDINNEKFHNSFKKGMLVWGCVQSVLDHGYEISLGVKNCRVFLPSKNVDGGRELSIGEPMWLTVHKSESTSSVTTLRVSSKAQHINDVRIEELNSLHDVIPGMQIEIVSETITSSGIQGKFLNNYFGYVDYTQLKSPLDQLNAYKEGKLITAFVLFVEPTTKITHLTLRNLDPVEPPSQEVGDIVSAKVISKGYNGVYLKLPSNEKGFVTNRRLVHALKENANLDVTEAISQKFAVGSKHTCRILDYNYLSRMYICAVDQQLVKEKVFGIKDVEIGQLLSVRVDSVKTEGLVVVSGHIRGFVPNLHISNSKYSEALKKKFKPGDKVNARVLFTKDDNIIFTLKSGLVESENCLTSLEQAKRGTQYAGVVVKTKPAGALVVFYDNIKGWLGRQRLNSDDEEIKADPTEYFYEGQVINPWVLGVKADKVILTLKPPTVPKKRSTLRVGQKITGIVGKVHKNRVDIKSPKGRLLGIVPINHLSSSTHLCHAFLKTIKVGDVMPDLLCVDNKSDLCILSRREALANNRCKKIKLKKFENLRPGILLRCSYVTDTDDGIYVMPLILDFTENILIKNKDIVNKGEPLPKFKKDQSIIGKILTIDYDTKEIRLTIKYKETFDKCVETLIGYFSQHLGDIKYLRDFGHKHGWQICQYRPGERVICKVEQVAEEGGCLVTLPNNQKGLVPDHLCPEDVEQGDTIEGVFLSQDFKDDFVEVCLRKDISQKINSTQDGIIQISSFASCVVEKILVKNDYILGLLKQSGGNKQLVYIPLYLQENDKKGCHEYYEKSKFKICICGKINNYLIGISKGLFLTLDKQKLLVKQKSLERKTETLNSGNGSPLKGSLSETVSEEEEEKEAIEEEVEEPSEEEDEKDDDESENKENVATNSSSDYSEDESLEKEEEEESFECNSLSDRSTKRKRDEKKTIKFGNDVVKNFDTSDSITGPFPVLPGVSSFFSQQKEEGEDTSSDEEEEVETVKKKKKLTPAERAELARQEEERIAKIENELADTSRPPQSAEQYERLLLAKPNSSQTWAQYIAFHMAATELDKARSVAKRALETIDMTLVTEKFNIWISLLNLENMFGTKESFDKTVEDAVKYNDALDIYLNVIKMLAESDKSVEMEEIIRKVRNKYKHEPNMWLEVAKIYYSNKKIAEARNLKEAAMKSISDKKTQLMMIMRFATMEFKYGEEQRGASIFETIINISPKNVNVWITYVDQLVKAGQIEQARKVLERSICQRLPVRSMKTLFLKFRMFEEQHGTPDSVQAVKEKAAEYVANVKN